MGQRQGEEENTDRDRQEKGDVASKDMKNLKGEWPRLRKIKLNKRMGVGEIQWSGKEWQKKIQTESK